MEDTVKWYSKIQFLFEKVLDYFTAIKNIK